MRSAIGFPDNAGTDLKKKAADDSVAFFLLN